MVRLKIYFVPKIITEDGIFCVGNNPGTPLFPCWLSGRFLRGARVFFVLGLPEDYHSCLCHMLHRWHTCIACRRALLACRRALGFHSFKGNALVHHLRLSHRHILACSMGSRDCTHLEEKNKHLG